MLKPAQILQGRYQLRQQLANHAGRQTWLAQDLNSSPPESVIVKLLAFSPQMQWDEFKLFEREAAVLKQLNHPQIPNYRDYFSLDKETGEGLYWFGLVQEYIPGKSLQQLLDQGYHFSETQVRSIAIQVLNILQYLHGLKPPVLHRDIKPNNLILGQDKRVYLVDFGAVQNSAAVEGVTFTVVGTSGYAPLEQFWGQAVAASDLYALGASLIHLLTGISPADLPQRELRIQFRDKVSINPQFLNWIEALSEPDLELRFKTASQALTALQQGHFGKFLEVKPQTNNKIPTNSRIKINKSVDYLSITIPAKPLPSLRDLLLSTVKILPIIGLCPIIILIYIMIILLFSPLSPLPLVYLFLIISISLILGIYVVNHVLFFSAIALFLVFLCSFILGVYTIITIEKLLIKIEPKIKMISILILNEIDKNIKNIDLISTLLNYSVKLDRDRFIFECHLSKIITFLKKIKINNKNRVFNYTDIQNYRQRDQTLCIQKVTANSYYNQVHIITLREIYTIYGLSKFECQWIIQEIKNWLN